MATLHFPFLHGSFDPESIRRSANPFEEVWQSFRTSGTSFEKDGHANAAREMLAKCIVEMAKLDGRDQRRLRDAALAHLAQANPQKAPKRE
jgi:hypothetical protein